MMEQMKVILEHGAFMPERAHAADAGYDLRCPEDVTIEGGESVTIDTGVHMLIPEGYAGVLVSKSGLNVNRSITSTGLIDAGYTGSIRVKLYNHSWRKQKFHAGDKISQIVIIPVITPELRRVDDFGVETERGGNGFGSSGV